MLGEEVLMKTPTYRVLLDHASKLQANLEAKENDITRLNNEISSFYASRSEWEEEVVVKCPAYV